MRPLALKMTPAPRNPTPLTMLAAIRESFSPPILNEKIVNKVAPTQMKIIVRNPADLSWYSRSAPINPPSMTESSNFITSCDVMSIQLTSFFSIL
jgi:hypothetical protein